MLQIAVIGLDEIVRVAFFGLILQSFFFSFVHFCRFFTVFWYVHTIFPH